MSGFPSLLIVGTVLTALTPEIARAGEHVMNRNVEVLKHMYDRFNARDIDGVLAMLAPDVVWANGMDGGYVYGGEGVREYWTRQWAVVSPHVEPLSFKQGEDGWIVVDVNQVIRDLEGAPVEASGLKDKTVGHIFHFRDGQVTRFEIRKDD
jgi:ketosteroid isomerase-like protein